MSTDVNSLLPIIRSQFSKLKVCSTHDKVYKDECVFSFDSPFSDSGLYVNLSSLLGFGADFLMQDIARGGVLYLHEKWTQVPKEPAAEETASEGPTKLAIGVEGGFAGEKKYDVVKVHQLAVATQDNSVQYVQLPCMDLPEFVSNVIQSIIDHDGMKPKMQAGSWNAEDERKESKYARSLVQLEAKKISQDASTWRCEESGDTQNLWLNLSTGYIGGGRKNWDGSGGSGAALKHYEDTGKKYPLCVKLGTITAHSADVYSYADDENDMVLDPLLAQHLSHWGIDIMKLEKTDKSMTEMEVDMNMKYDWSKITEDGEQLESVSGAGYVGLENVGSTCYMNSVLQALFTIPEFRERYLNARGAIRGSAPSDPVADFASQFAKVAEALHTEKYVPSAEAQAATTTVTAGEASPDAGKEEKYRVAPRMLKQLVGRDHPEFSSGRQQDASEYFMHLLETMTKAERTALSRILPGGSGSPPYTASIFDFQVETRYECNVTQMVRYVCGKHTKTNTLELRIPLDSAINKEEVETQKESKKARIESGATNGGEEDDIKLIVPYEACLATFFDSETIEFTNPTLGQAVPTTRAAKMKNFPRYLMVKLGRYYVGPNWVQVKVDARVPMPDTLNLETYRGRGIQDGEMPMPDEVSSSGTPAGSASGAIEPDMEIVAQLISMGFSENGCKRATIATQNSGAEAAMNWVFEHMEDSNFNEPLPAVEESAGADAGPPAEMVDMICAMGYTPEQAKGALKATDNNIERAMDWIFSHMDDLDAAVHAANSASEGGGGGAGGDASSESTLDDGEGVYSLLAIVSHIGRNTDHGHYVCHIKKESGWVVYNDDKVAKSKSPPVEYGFMYLYRRVDGSGSLQ